MGIVTIVIIAIGLSMDSFAVSVCNGLTIKKLTLKKKCFISFLMALFQGVMPLIGWLAGTGVEKYIKEIDHWVAFVLLFVIGAKMIYEGLQEKELGRQRELKIGLVFMQSMATSIDALAVGISFAFLDIVITTSVLIIFITTFIFSLIGLYIGKYAGKYISSYVEIFGGTVLIGIGIKILLEHLYFQ
jgi:putative Mn2+ efflux pump MntP